MIIHVASRTLLTLSLLVGCTAKIDASSPADTKDLARKEAITPLASTSAGEGKTSPTEENQVRHPKDFPAYVDTLKEKARKRGISERTLSSAFEDIHFVKHIVQADRAQPEKKMTLDIYLSHVISAQKIENAKRNYQLNQPILTPISQKYSIPAKYIVALWAMESDFGRRQGKENIISALATLAFEGRRESFFTNELMAALSIIQQKHITAAAMKGSWAGAMGQNQFMPSSFSRYAVDGDGDGKIDIWNNLSDVFASTANYLATEGWKKDEGWGNKVEISKNFPKNQVSLKNEQAKTVSEWEALGVRIIDKTSLPKKSQRAWVILPDDGQGEPFMVYDNFRTLMHWNRSYHFAISIGKMADYIIS